MGVGPALCVIEQYNTEETPTSFVCCVVTCCQLCSDGGGGGGLCSAAQEAEPQSRHALTAPSRNTTPQHPTTQYSFTINHSKILLIFLFFLLGSITLKKNVSFKEVATK